VIDSYFYHMSANLLDSLKFRLHVRNILQAYVKQHCTKDYLTFTEDVLSEVRMKIAASYLLH